MSPSKESRIQNETYLDDFFRSHYGTLCYFAYSYLKNKEIAEDVVQNTFVNLLYDAEHKFDDEKHLKFFLYKSIKNSCLNELKKLSVQTKTLDDLSTENNDESDFDTFQLIVRAETYKEILDAINLLPDRCAEIFKLAYMEQLDNNEIAQQLSISINTVKVQKNNAKKILREQLKHLYPIVIFLFSL